jgi:hypothetical protein
VSAYVHHQLNGIDRFIQGELVATVSPACLLTAKISFVC